MNLTTSSVDLVSTNVRYKDVHLYTCLQVLQSYSSFNPSSIHIWHKGIHSIHVHSIPQDSVHSIHTRDQLWDQLQLQLRAQQQVQVRLQLPSSFCHRYRDIHIHSKDIHSVHSIHTRDQLQHWGQPQLLHWVQPPH